MINYSVIIPQKDCASLTKRCLQSIPPREDIQIIVVDDNSSDINELICVEREFNRNNSLFIYTKDGKGAGFARNVGLSKALGKWLIFADADDYFSLGAFEVFDQFVNSDKDIVYFFHSSVYSDTLQPCLRYDSRNLFLRKYLQHHSKKYENELKYADVVPWAKMFRKSLVEEKKQKFDEVPASNDVLFVSRMAYYAHNIDVSDRSIYTLTFRRGSITHIRNRTNELSRYQVCLEFNNFLKGIGCKNLRNRIISRVWIAFKNFGLKEAILYLKLAHKSKQSLFTGLLPKWSDVKIKLALIGNKNAFQG